MRKHINGVINLIKEEFYIREGLIPTALGTIVTNMIIVDYKAMKMKPSKKNDVIKIRWVVGFGHHGFRNYRFN